MQQLWSWVSVPMLIDSQQHVGSSATISKRQKFKYTLRTVFPYSRKKLIGTSCNYWKPLHGQLVKCRFRCARPRCDRRVHRNSSALTSGSCLNKFINWWLPQWPSNTWMVLVCASFFIFPTWTQTPAFFQGSHQHSQKWWDNSGRSPPCRPSLHLFKVQRV